MQNKRIAIYSNSWDTNAGGGIVYILAIAKILTQRGYDTTVFFYDSVKLTELYDRYETFGLKIKIINRKPSPLFFQFKFALKECLNFDVVIQQSLIAPRLTFIRKSFILTDFPMKKIVTVSENIRLKSWRNIIVNSEFTNFWVRKYWKRSSNVIYPPIETPVTLNIKKNDDIVCIGRFNQGKRSKKQEVIIQVVIDLIKNKTIKSKLHLIGYIQDNDYFNSLKLQSKDYPIYFYDKCSSEKRNEILNNSAIFISACGFEIDEEKEPMYLEHYGISVVEAMSFGCIPLVIGKGGHKETVENKINGYHWQTIEELKENIVELFENNLLREEMSLNAFEKSKLYSYDCLQNSILKLIVK